MLLLTGEADLSNKSHEKHTYISISKYATQVIKQLRFFMFIVTYLDLQFLCTVSDIPSLSPAR